MRGIEHKIRPTTVEPLSFGDEGDRVVANDPCLGAVHPSGKGVPGKNVPVEYVDKYQQEIARGNNHQQNTYVAVAKMSNSVADIFLECQRISPSEHEKCDRDDDPHHKVTRK